MWRCRWSGILSTAVREKALGQEVLRSVTPAQMVVKIVHDHLVEVLGGGEGARQDQWH